MTSTAPAWLMPVVAICILQTISSFLTRLIPIVAPAMSVEFGWSGSSIGYLTASNSMGGLAILLAGSALFKQIGGMRTLQLTLSLGAVCLAFLLYPSLGVALAACFAMGLSNGAANPAGSEVLQRFSPPGKRNLMFSIKQAGVPLGGVMAGLLVPVVHGADRMSLRQLRDAIGARSEEATSGAFPPAALTGGAPVLPRRVGPDRLRLRSAERIDQFAHLTYDVLPPG